MAPKYEKAKAIERENVIVDGIDVSGHWNRMFEQRVITEYTPELIEKIADIPNAESFANCYQCAKCVAVCPVDVVGNYGPRKLYRYAQTGMDLTEAPELWLCTTCANCLRVCPKEVNMVKIMPAAREQAILDGKFVPPELQQAFENTAKSGNPLGQPQRKRDAWIQNAGVPVPIIKDAARPVDVLWYVGSYPSYHPRGIDAASAAARIFNALGIDFAILGKEEKDDADSQRLAGEKGLFEMMTEYNIETFNKYEWKELVVTGPHELNAFKNVYPKYGFERPVLHYTTFLVRYLDQLKPMLKHPVNKKITYHDPCYLGRYAHTVNEPRALLTRFGGEVREPERNRENPYCCGAGGGLLFADKDEEQGTRISDVRFAQLRKTGASTVVTACPFCSIMLKGAQSSAPDAQVQFVDLMTFVNGRLEKRPPS